MPIHGGFVMNAKLFFFLFVFVLFCGVRVSHAQNNSFEKSTILLSQPEKDLLKEFLHVVPRVHSFYTNIQMEVDLSRYQNESQDGVFPAPSTEELPLAGRSHLSYYVSSTDNVLDSYYRLDVADYGRQESLDEPEERWVGIANPNESYLINHVGKNIYSLAGQEKTSDEILSRYIFSEPFHSAPYAISGVPVTRWLFGMNNTTVQSVTLDKSSSDEVVVVLFKRHYPKGDTRFECRFIRNKGWALLYVQKTSIAPDDHEGGFIVKK